MQSSVDLRPRAARLSQPAATAIDLAGRQPRYFFSPPLSTRSSLPLSLSRSLSLSDTSLPLSFFPALSNSPNPSLSLLSLSLSLKPCPAPFLFLFFFQMATTQKIKSTLNNWATLETPPSRFEKFVPSKLKGQWGIFPFAYPVRGENGEETRKPNQQFAFYFIYFN